MYAVLQTHTHYMSGQTSVCVHVRTVRAQRKDSTVRGSEGRDGMAGEEAPVVNM